MVIKDMYTPHTSQFLTSFTNYNVVLDSIWGFQTEPFFFPVLRDFRSAIITFVLFKNTSSSQSKKMIKYFHFLRSYLNPLLIQVQTLLTERWNFLRRETFNECCWCCEGGTNVFHQRKHWKTKLLQPPMFRGLWNRNRNRIWKFDLWLKWSHMKVKYKLQT